MTPERWQEIDRLYQAAVELQPAEREQFLAAECADEEIRREVEALVAAHYESRIALHGAPEKSCRPHDRPL